MARFLRTIFMNTAEECAQLRAGALKNTAPPAFGSFQLHGDNLRPERIELYAPVIPVHDTKPVAVYIRLPDGDLAPEKKS